MVDILGALIIAGVSASLGAGFGYVSSSLQAGAAHRRQLERDANAQQNHAEEVRLGRQWDGQRAQFDRVFPAYKAVFGAASVCHTIAQEMRVIRARDGTEERRDERLGQQLNAATTDLRDALLTLSLVDTSDVLTLSNESLHLYTQFRMKYEIQQQMREMGAVAGSSVGDPWEHIDSLSSHLDRLLASCRREVAALNMPPPLPPSVPQKGPRDLPSRIHDMVATWGHPEY